MLVHLRSGPLRFKHQTLHKLVDLWAASAFNQPKTVSLSSLHQLPSKNSSICYGKRWKLEGARSGLWGWGGQGFPNQISKTTLLFSLQCVVMLFHEADRRVCSS
jgi:hypothetical protein